MSVTKKKDKQAIYIVRSRGNRRDSNKTYHFTNKQEICDFIGVSLKHLNDCLLRDMPVGKTRSYTVKVKYMTPVE